MFTKVGSGSEVSRGRLQPSKIRTVCRRECRAKRKGKRRAGTALSGIQPPASDPDGGHSWNIRIASGAKYPLKKIFLFYSGMKGTKTSKKFIFISKNAENSDKIGVFEQIVVEHMGFEPTTPTLPV